MYNSLLRSNTFEESQVPGHPDRAVIVEGSQTISYDSTGNSSDVVQRIDKQHTVSDFFFWTRPSLEPFNVSLVVRGGPSGYACYIRGNDHVLNPSESPFGYTDRESDLQTVISLTRDLLNFLAFLANILVRDATRLSPKLLLDFQKHPKSLTADQIYYHSAGPYPSVHDRSLNLTVLFDPETYLPFVVRAYENPRLFGPSTNDFVLNNYTVVDDIHIPRAVHTLYNEKNLLVHTIRDVITVNPGFAADFFDGLSEDLIAQTGCQLTGSQLKPAAAELSTEYDAAEVFENR